MFGNKRKVEETQDKVEETQDKVEELQDRVDRLEEALSKIPKMQECSECGEIKSKSRFFNYSMPTLSIFQIDDYYLDYCDTCKPKVDLRNEAVKAAKDNPEKVLKCVNKGK